MAARVLPALLLAAVAAACGSLSPSPRTVPGGEALPEEARAAYLATLRHAARGETGRARAALEPLLALRPLHVPSHLLRQDLARAPGGEGNLAGEYAALAAALPASADAALLAVRAGDLPLALRIEGYQAAAVRDPSSPWPRIALALARSALAAELRREADGKALEGYAAEARRLAQEAREAAERARTEAERTVALAGDLAPAHAALAHALAVAASAGDREDAERRALRGAALESYGRALLLDPGDPAVLLGRALLLRETGRGEESLADLEAAARAAPGDAAVLAARARALGELGRGAEALDAWEAVLEAAPGWAEAWMDAGSASQRMGEEEEALKRFRRADGLFAVNGGMRWRARRGIASILAQRGLDRGETAPFAEALAHVRAYREEGGPDRAWADRMAYLLGGDGARPGEEGEAGEE